METVNKQKNLETRPENIDYKEFWGHSISKNRYLKEKKINNEEPGYTFCEN